jgi:hypothetical protein
VALELNFEPNWRSEAATPNAQLETEKRGGWGATAADGMADLKIGHYTKRRAAQRAKRRTPRKEHRKK